MSKKKSKKKKTSKKAKTTKKAKAEKATKQFDRLMSSVVCLAQFKGSITIEQGIKKADEIYVKHGGQSNIKESKYSFTRALKVMSLCGFLKVENGLISRLSAPFTIKDSRD